MPNEVSFESMLGIENEVPVEDMVENESDVSFDSMLGESSYPGAPGSRKVGYPKPKIPSWASADEINPKGLDLNQPMFKDTIQGMLFSEFKKPGSVPILHEPVIDYDKAKKGITESLVGMKELAMNPMEGIRGAASFLADIPGFVVGIAKAAGNMVSVAANGRNLSVSDFYDAASEGMSGAMKDWKKVFTEPLLGEETKASSIIPTIAMSPALVISEYANMLASGKGYKDSPNTQGVLRFVGDIGGLVALGSLYKGGRTDATVKTRAIVDKAIEIDKEQKIADANPDAAIKAAQQKIIDAKKIQLELEAKEIMNNLDYGKIIKEDLAGKGERIKQIKQPKKFIVDEVVNKANEKLPEAKKVVEKPAEKPVVETPKVEVPESTDLEAAEIDMTIKDIEKEYGRPIEEISDAEVESYYEKVYKETDNDLSMEVTEREPVMLDTEHSPFRETSESTKARTELFNKTKGVTEDPELFTSKLINDVNRWLDGEEVPIKEVRNGLSEFATRAEEIRDYFRESEDYPSNFENWKEMVSEAASWARKAKRQSSDVQLNMMIPLDKIPDYVLELITTSKSMLNRFIGTYDKSGIPAGDLYRNKAIFDRSGFWLGRDGKWRYELNTDYKNIKDVVNKNEWVGPLKDAINDPELFKAVSGIEDVYVKVKNLGSTAGRLNNGINGYYIEINPLVGNPKETLIHEVQHLINRKLGAFEGGNVTSEKTNLIRDILTNIIEDDKVSPEAKFDANKLLEELKPDNTFQTSAKLVADQHKFNIPRDNINNLIDLDMISYGNYAKLPGEMEARLTSKRMDLSSEQRKKTPPWETLDSMISQEGFSGSPGTKLYDIGGATAEGAKQIIDAAKRAKDYIVQSRGMKSFKPMQAAKMLKEELVRTWVDRSGNIRKSLLEKEGSVGYEILQKMYLSKGASARAAMNLKQMQKEVYRGLNKNEKRILDSLIFHNRMVDLAKYKTPKQFKYFKEHPIDESIAYIELLGQLEKLSPEQVADMHNRAAGYFEWMKKPLKDMYESGLISQQEYTDLAAHNYRKLKLVDIFDNRYETKIGDKKRTVYDSGVESLARGKDTDIFESSSEIMALEVFNRAYGRIMNNEANKNLLKLARTDIKNPFVRVKENIPEDWHKIVIKEGEDTTTIYAPKEITAASLREDPSLINKTRETKDTNIPSGWDRVFVFENGERKALYLSPELSKEWIINNPELSFKMSQLLRYASGSQVLRTFATGINWGFALANMPRDIMHTWFAARAWENGKWKPIYSPHAPVFGLQITRDVSSVFTDALLRKGRYEDYLNEGGGMEFMVHQGRLLQKGRHLEGTLDKIENFLGYFGETSEILTRLAIRERALRKGKKAQEATFIARDYMDFGQGGSIAKAVDNALPYLNASIQGSRGIFRAFKDNPLRSTYKLAQFGALVTGVYISMDKRSPETKKNLQGDPAMTSNLVIPFGDEFGFIDKNGQTRYPYIKIPLDPGQRFFKKFFEASTDKWLGNEIDVSGTVKALGELSPVDVGSLPPTLSSTLGYITNKDFWLNEDIWKDSDTFGYPNSKQEFNARTPELAVDIGNLTGLSPERLKYAVGELVPSNTAWAYLAGKGYDEVFGDMLKENKEQHLAMVLSQVPGINRFIGITNPYSKYSEKIDKVQEAQVIKEFIENRNFDIKVNAFLRGEGVTRQDLVKEAGQYKDRDTYNRLMDRLKFEEGIKNLPEKSFWRRMKGLRMEAKAQVFVDRLNNSTPEEATQLWKEYAIVARAKGIISPELRKEIGRLRAKN